MEKLNITFCSFPDFSGNAKALYEYMEKRYKNKMNFIWAVNSDEMKDKLNTEGISAYKIGTKEYYNEMKKTDVFFTTHCNILGEKNDHSIYVELWHGISPKKQGYISDNMSQGDEMFYYQIKEKVDYMIVPSEFWRIIFSARFNLEYSKILPLGYPKLDYMVNSNAKENLAKLLGKDVSHYNKIIYYMPTFRLGCDRAQEAQINTNNLINIQSYDEEKLKEYLKVNNYLLCVKKHPSEQLNLKEIETDNIAIIKEEELQKNNITVNEILNAADLMITDYSSLGVEFLFLDKPVIYLTNDIDEYLKNRGFAFNNVSFWMASYQVKKYDELIEAVSGCFSKNFKYKEALKEKRNLWFSDLKNGGCQKICDFIFDGNKLKINREKNDFSVVDKLQQRVNELSQILDEKNETIAIREARIKELDEFIANIINSKGWRFLERVRKISKPFKK